MNPAVVSRETGALSVRGGQTDKDVIVEENAEGNEKAVKENAHVPLISWLSLVMLLLVYISNQWSRSLVYCECGSGRFWHLREYRAKGTKTKTKGQQNIVSQSFP